MKADSSFSEVVRRLAIADLESISTNIERKRRKEVKSITLIQFKTRSKKRDILIVNKLL